VVSAPNPSEWQRVAVVTGAGTGLGRATAEVLGAASIACVLVGRRGEPLNKVAASDCFPAGVHVVQADVADAGGRARIVEEALDVFGRVDILVNNAGVSQKAPLLDTTEEDWRRVLSINLDGCFFLAQAVIPDMRSRNYGRIVNIASVYGSHALNASLYGGLFPADAGRGPTRQPAYHTSKGGLLNLTRDLAVAVAPWGITVNAISPGMFLTEQSNGIVNEEVIKRLSEMTPVGRLGEPSEIGHAVKFLVSEEAAFITGAELRVDGGWTIW
jgi:NAD(P)-dependent dehydrogenase (short-subunit alcohol dehydrogenase family)